MKNQEASQAMEQVTTAKQAPVSLVKAYRIELHGQHLWTEIAGNVVAECLDEEEKQLLTLEAVEAMAPGDRLQVPRWCVVCSMVDPDWLKELPEHDGW